jgi:hypothetical protein
MSIPTSVLGFFRTEWASRFTDTCVVNRVTGRTLNTSTGVYTPTLAAHYSGGCVVRPQSPSSAEAGQELVEQRGYLVVLPYDEADVRPDDIVTVTSTTDTQLNGKQLVVRNVRTDTYNSARKLDCEDNQGASG